MIRFSIFLFAFSFVVTGCNKESSDTDTSPSASVSVYAVAPGAPELNFFLNGNNIAASVPFGSYTLYNRVSPGMVRLQAQSSSRSINIDTNFSVTENRYYSLFFTGSATAIKTVVLRDSFPAPDSGYCRLRFFVLSPGLPAINFHVLKTDSTIKGIGWANRSYSDNIANDSINTFKKFAQGTYSFFAINKANSKDTIARFTGKTFSDSLNYTLMLEGHLSSADTSLLLGTRLH